MAGEGHGTKAIVAAFFANLGIAIAKFVGFLLTGSASMLAESIHSVADTGNQALLLLGGRRARREATPLFPFGYGRERYFWSFVVALVLFSLGSLFAIYEGIHKLEHPEPLESPDGRLRHPRRGHRARGASRCARPSWSRGRVRRATQAWLRVPPPPKTPELPVVLLEDIGAQARPGHRPRRRSPPRRSPATHAGTATAR